MNPLSPVRILLIETDVALCAPIPNLLLAGPSAKFFDFISVTTLAAAYRRLEAQPIDLILMDLDPREDPELSPLTRLRSVDPETPVVAILTERNKTAALEVLHKGAQDYLLQGQVHEEMMPAFILRAIERHAREKAMRESEERLRVMIENVSDVILTLDAAGNVTFAGPSIEPILGWKPADFVGRNLLDFLHRDDRRAFLDRFESAVDSGGTMSFLQFRVRRLDGTWMPMEGRGRIVASPQSEKTCVVNCHDVSHRVKMEEELRTLSLRDELTGLHNRRSFVTFIDQQIKLSQRTNKRGLCLLMIDLDGFKQINDTLGHKEGDRALIEAATILKNTFRDADIVARLGGDEFVVFLTESIEEAQVEALKKRLHDSLEAANSKDNRRYRLAMSVGSVYHDPVAHRSPEDLLHQADELMYAQKRERKRQAALAAGTPAESVQARN